FSTFVNEKYRVAFTAMQPEMDKAVKEAQVKYASDPAMRTKESFRIGREMAARIPRPPLSSLIDQIAHIAQVAVGEQVGLGFHFRRIPASPRGLNPVTHLRTVLS